MTALPWVVTAPPRVAAEVAFRPILDVARGTVAGYLLWDREHYYVGLHRPAAGPAAPAEDAAPALAAGLGAVPVNGPLYAVARGGAAVHLG